jgi:hypothetical protein
LFYLKSAPIAPLMDAQLDELRTAFAVRW